MDVEKAKIYLNKALDIFEELKLIKNMEKVKVALKSL